MDPYFEGVVWMTIHAQLSNEIARQLAPRLRPKYVVLTPERFILDRDEGVAVITSNIYPDVGVAHAGGKAPEPSMAVLDAPLRSPTVVPIRVPHVRVEIRDVADRELVTAIEVLSPTNKNNPGRREYLKKRRRILLSDTHLMAIDLLRGGRRVPMRKPLPDYPYFVLLSRAELRPLVDIWPIGYRDTLPTHVPVPLLPGDADVHLDLQAAWSSIYDAFCYDLLVDYTQPPALALPPSEAAWAVELLGRRASSG
jgi:hypothetical protein